MSKNKKELDDQFDIETETVINMAKRNRQKRKREAIKAEQKKLRRRKKAKRILKIFVFLALITGGCVFALVSPIFNIQEIEVYNNEIVSTDTVISLSQLNIGQNIFRFSKAITKREIKTNPYIEDVKISRKLPSKIEITVQERQRNFNVQFLNGYAYINNQGYILEISEEKLEVPTIQGTSTEETEFVAGNRLNVEDLEKLETVIQIMSICKEYEIDSKVTTINIENKNNYIIYMEQENKEIYLGDATNLNNKMLYVPILLEENKDKAGTIYLDGDLNNNFRPRFRESI